ncbi:hypothetical protein D3C80_1666690 [compost metagenome]
MAAITVGEFILTVRRGVDRADAIDISDAAIRKAPPRRFFGVQTGAVHRVVDGQFDAVHPVVGPQHQGIGGDTRVCRHRQLHIVIANDFQQGDIAHVGNLGQHREAVMSAVFQVQPMALATEDAGRHCPDVRA